jgi:hypothetical protein
VFKTVLHRSSSREVMRRRIFNYIKDDTGMASLKQEAIDAKCKDCCSDEANEGTWREQVEKNPCGSCPLSTFRPKTIATVQLERAQRVVNRLQSQPEGPRLH